MLVMDTFDSTKESLSGLLSRIHEGDIQLPDFQRGWVWDDAHIRSLLASVSRSFPIGAVMMLETGNPDVRFKPRVVEGVPPAPGADPERLILDGQQRLTSLYQSLRMNEPVRTRIRGKDVRRWYYVDIEKALDPALDREDAIVALPEDRIRRDFRNEVTADYSTRDREVEDGLFPLSLAFDIAGVTKWGTEYMMYGSLDFDTKANRWNEFLSAGVLPFQQYQLPVIELRKKTPKEAVCLVFEKVNTGGVSLTVFELLTASFAADDFNLRDDWRDRVRTLVDRPILKAIRNTDFLQAVTLVSRYQRRASVAVSCKKSDVLRLPLEEYKRWAEPVTNGFLKAAKLLHSERIFTDRDLPYPTQLVPLAALYSVLGDRADSDSSRSKIIRWFWCGVFGELYGSSTETRFARDLPELVDWINGTSDEPSTIRESNFVPERLRTLRTRNSAAYKGLHALLLRDGALDFRTGESIDVQTYFDENIDIHHIFPRAFCEKLGIPAQSYNSIVNKTPLSSRTNRMIGGRPPSVYLETLQRGEDIDRERLNYILSTHAIDPGTLRADDYAMFIDTRAATLLRRIEQVTGKSIIRDLTNETYAEDDDYDELADLYENVAD